MADIKETISKLLNLADSPNENEARTALLKARALMAKHKLSLHDLNTEQDTQVCKQGIGIYCTKMTDTWAVPLAITIAGHYCCKAYSSHVHGSKTTQIGFVGLKDDFAVCVRIYRYAHCYVKANCEVLKRQSKKSGRAASEIRQICNAYGVGFCGGLLKAYREQDKDHQEWGLVLKTPPIVEDTVNAMGPATSYTKIETGGSFAQFTERGFRDGKAFDPERGYIQK